MRPGSSTGTPPSLIGAPGAAPFPFTSTTLVSLTLEFDSRLGPSLMPLLQGCTSLEHLTFVWLSGSVLRLMRLIPVLLRKLTLLSSGEDYRDELDMLRTDFGCLSTLKELEVMPLDSEEAREELEKECKVRGIEVVWSD